MRERGGEGEAETPSARPTNKNPPKKKKNKKNAFFVPHVGILSTFGRQIVYIASLSPFHTHTTTTPSHLCKTARERSVARVWCWRGRCWQGGGRPGQTEIRHRRENLFTRTRRHPTNEEGKPNPREGEKNRLASRCNRPRLLSERGRKMRAWGVWADGGGKRRRRGNSWYVDFFLPKGVGWGQRVGWVGSGGAPPLRGRGPFGGEGSTNRFFFL